MTGPAPYPQGGGLYRHILTNGNVDHAKWLRAYTEHRHVGECRHCSNYLRPERPHPHHGRTDYEATCINETCARTVAAPGGRVLARTKNIQKNRGK